MRYLRGLIYFWLIVSAPLLGMAPLAQGAFLCWGAGGHVGVETEACESHCESPTSSSDHEESSARDDCEDDESCCGACIDIPLPSGVAIKQLLRRAGGSVLRGVTVCIMHIAEPDVTGFKAAEEYSRFPRPGAGGESIASLRTIVLLI